MVLLLLCPGDSPLLTAENLLCWERSQKEERISPPEHTLLIEQQNTELGTSVSLAILSHLPVKMPDEIIPLLHWRII